MPCEGKPALATWRNGLRSGLQSRLSEFDSRRRLHSMDGVVLVVFNKHDFMVVQSLRSLVNGNR